jgi:hypothetical protein
VVWYSFLILPIYGFVWDQKSRFKRRVLHA